MTGKLWTIVLGVLLLLVGLGFYGFETVMHEQRDKLVLYGAYGFVALGVILAGLADEVAKGVGVLATAWAKRKGGDDA